MTYIINVNLVFSEQNKYDTAKSVNQQKTDLATTEIKYNKKNTGEFDVLE